MPDIFEVPTPDNELLQKANANDQIKLGVMSTLLDDLKTKDELIKKGKKLN